VARTVSDPALATLFRTLGELHGGPEVLDQAREAFAEAPQAVNDALDKLYDLYQGVQREHPEVDCYFDLAELRGYQYHTGMMFAAYVPGYGQALAKGGRYDDTGRAFGRARPATGFSMDLKLLATLATKDPAGDSVWAPADEGAPGLDEAVQKLRRQGRRVIQGLPGQRAPGHDCSEQLVARGQEWVLEPLTT
ncbi:MAG: ATP phosphoribosyltransferase regulatory subunit, partial [Pseudomonadota bacterium]|nr:ATP phosphoribosyltransferase regulatory subunit [Pseudomonadota bacterium]